MILLMDMKENMYATITSNFSHSRHHITGCTLSANTNTMSYLSASIAATILIPVTLWLLNLMIQNKKKHDNDKKGQ